MYSQALAATVEAVERRFVRQNIPLGLVDFEETPSQCVADCPDPFYHNCPERAERDRQASLEFLHRLVVGGTDV